MRFVGVDIGTSSTKAIVVDELGQVVSSAAVSYSTRQPLPHWSEQDPDEWCSACERAMGAVGAKNADAISFTGQMHGAVLLDQDQKVIRPAILWNDQRTASEVLDLETRFGDLIRHETLNPPMTGFQLPKLLWVKQHEPAAFSRIRHVLLPKDYVRFRVSGELTTEPSDASGTGLFNVSRRAWSGQLMDALDIPRSWFAPIHESAQTLGATKNGVPVAVGAGDQAAAAIGVGSVVPEVASVCLGTSGVVFRSLPSEPGVGEDSVHRFCHANGGWHQMGVVLSCAGAVQWFRDVFCPQMSFEDLSSLAASVSKGCKGLSFQPYLAGERCPYVEPNATASFLGATTAHGLADFSRAVFEGATYGLWGAARAVGIDSQTEIRVTGGGAKSDFWMQLLANALGTPCYRTEIDEGPAFGAALLGATSVGAFDSVGAAANATVRLKRRFVPEGDAYESQFLEFDALHARIARG